MSRYEEELGERVLRRDRLFPPLEDTPVHNPNFTYECDVGQKKIANGMYQLNQWEALASSGFETSLIVAGSRQCRDISPSLRLRHQKQLDVHRVDSR